MISLTLSNAFTKLTFISNWIAKQASRPLALVLALLLIIIWLSSGPFFTFNETWLLLINTTLTIITFLMVFIIQSTQARENRALNLKVDELLRSSEKAENGLMAVEEVLDADLEKLKDQYSKMGKDERDKGIELIINLPPENPPKN